MILVVIEFGRFEYDSLNSLRRDDIILVFLRVREKSIGF
jgi:hypothetical protein